MADIKGAKNYDRIRRYIEHIYLYGFYTRDDFAKAGIGSVQDYDYGTSLIRAIYPDMNDTALWSEGKKQLRFLRRYICSGENRLADSYLLCTMDEKEDLPRLLHTLKALAAPGMTRQQLLLSHELNCGDHKEADFEPPSESTLRRLVNELADYGFLDEHEKKFQVKKNRLEALSDKELLQLYDYIVFASGTTYPRVPGCILRRSIKRECVRRQIQIRNEYPVLLRHNAKRCIFDEENVYIVLEALMGYTKKDRTTKVTSRFYPHISMPLRGKKQIVVPIALRVDTKLGRWYLLAHNGTGPIIRRLSRVSDIQICKTGVTEAERNELAAQVLKAYSDNGCSGLLSESGPILVEVELNFDQMPGLFWQFKRELRVGEIVEHDGKRLFCAHVSDPRELLPWLRSYAPWIKILPGNHDLDTRLRNDMINIRKNLQDHGGTCT